jgi:uncharacterized protein (TIGR02996 family)
MSSDEAALLRTICESPDDDLPRLVYADWLDEHGRADRAEFIRVQCEAARLITYDDRHTKLRQRARKLFEAHGRRWLADDWPEADPNQPVDGRSFERGFFCRVSMTTRRLGGVRVQEITHTRPRLAFLREWGLGGNNLGNVGVRAVADCPWLSRLERLDLRGNPYDVATLEALAASPHLTSLREVRIGRIREPDPLYDQARHWQVEGWFRRHGKEVTVSG